MRGFFLPDTAGLMARINALPPDRIAEIEDFVAFIADREQARALTHAAATASAPSFAAVWDNEEDAVYDAI
jgi:hypothetical protein